jgi:hypothetical protein
MHMVDSLSILSQSAQRGRCGIWVKAMRPFFVPVLLLLLTAAANAQTQLITEGYFPAEFEFGELKGVVADRSLDRPEAMKSWANGNHFLEAGCTRIEEREYETGSGGRLRIVVARFADAAGAYSLFTLMRWENRAAGALGEMTAVSASSVDFVRSAVWVRIAGGGEDLRLRVARSMRNRIGPLETAAPGLITQLPERGLEASSVRYFLGPRSFERWSEPAAIRPIRFSSEMEIVQARYSLPSGAAALSMIRFPTIDLAEGYYSGLEGGASIRREAGTGLFVRRSGAIVALLSGSLPAAAADELLGAIRYRYSIRWIYDKTSQRGKTVWGVPVGILGTVVRSIALTALLCCASLVIGAGIALFRLSLRRYAPGNFLDNPDRSAMIRLHLSEDSRQGALARVPGMEEGTR